MRAAFNGIQYCCEALSEGKVQVQRIKKAADDAKTIVAETRNLWSTLKSIFGGKPKPAPATVSSPAPAAKKREQVTTHVPNSDELVQQFVDNLGEWFKQYQALSEYADRRYAEVFAQEKLDLTEVLKLTTLQAELDGSYAKLSETMTVRAPMELGPIWSRFNEMQERVKREQQARRQRDRITRQKEAARVQREHDERVAMNLTIFYAVMTVMYFWWFMWALWDSRWQK